VNAPAAHELPCLAVVTCGPQLEVALQTRQMKVASLVRLGGVAPRSTLLLAAVDLVVEDAGISPADLATIVVSRGPGSFTGIRAGLATVAGLEAGIGARCVAYDSLLMLAARCAGDGVVWSAQPGRRGEIYARRFRLVAAGPPIPEADIEIMAVADAVRRGPWVAAESLDLGAAERASVARSAAEGLLHLAAAGAPPDSFEPLYVEGPPVPRVAAD
jgi:tRNA threonylcarbamoyl adenosine modification protein YeaZ